MAAAGINASRITKQTGLPKIIVNDFLAKNRKAVN